MTGGRVIAVGGHESDGAAALTGVLGPEVVRVAGGRELVREVRSARADGERVCVVPMTLGRDPSLVADAARTLLALDASERAGTVLAEPFATTAHLVGWLRTLATRVPDDRALLVTAPSGDPFSDADLFRTARLVRQYGRHRTVEVALLGGDPGLAEGVRRCRALGAPRVVVLPAAWAVPEPTGVPHAEYGGPLLSGSAAAGVLASRVREAQDRYERSGDDGVKRALAADHDHGHTHSHGPDGHDHDHDHGHDHGHGHSHSHGHGDRHGPGPDPGGEHHHRTPSHAPRTGAEPPVRHQGAAPDLVPSHRSPR
ncbi:sirohydrochlorin chelatase [Streptomyces albidoflavus]|uniref:sirohydrochlorin chelatase n=1 Tax=Streptomyces albidoflavus TaxID=1886 RepID=UPI0038733BCF|nr:cobalamin biosynthesis protein CbiX [Streptomyces albidoflavus]